MRKSCILYENKEYYAVPETVVKADIWCKNTLIELAE